jgi:hypothetical protein
MTPPTPNLTTYGQQTALPNQNEPHPETAANRLN